MSWMKVVGEWVGRMLPATSPPRGPRAPPRTVIVGDTTFSASYVFTSRLVYAGAAASLPSSLNCGSQYRFRFGSLPTTKIRKLGIARAIDAAYDAKSA